MRKNITFWSTSFIVLILFFMISGYAYYRTKDFLNGPQIVVFNPNDGTTLTDSLIQIQGNIKNANVVTLDDRKIYLDEAGDFNEKLLLSPGYNIITIKVEDRFKRTAQKQVPVVFKSE